MAPENFNGDATTDRLDPTWKAQVVESTYSTRLAGLLASLTFQGHVTSSVTWPFDSPYMAHMLFPIGGSLEPSLYL